MTGTLVNTSAIIIGSAVGLSVGAHISKGVRGILMQALGLAVLAIGLKMALSGFDLIPAVACLLLGGLTGEMLRIEDGLEWLGVHLKEKFKSNSATFVQGFVAATILYITGAMTIIGCIQDGTVGDASTLYLKSLLDGVASIALASTLGVGVMLSAVSVLIIQGGLTILASYLHFLQQPDVLGCITATGGMVILGIGINLLDLRKIRVGNLSPAVIYAAIYPLIFS